MCLRLTTSSKDSSSKMTLQAYCKCDSLPCRLEVQGNQPSLFKYIIMLMSSGFPAWRSFLVRVCVCVLQLCNDHHRTVCCLQGNSPDVSFGSGLDHRHGGWLPVPVSRTISSSGSRHSAISLISQLSVHTRSGHWVAGACVHFALIAKLFVCSDDSPCLRLGDSNPAALRWLASNPMATSNSTNTAFIKATAFATEHEVCGG